MQASADQMILRLQDELNRTRQSVMEMMPWEVRLILMSYDSCKTRHDSRLWPHTAAAKIIDLAKILPPTIFRSNRACCPLCGADGSDRYSSGFSVPEGLSRHLLGWSNSTICPMFDIVRRMADEEWDEKFFDVEQQERDRIKERKKTEILYKTGPNEEPRLLDEGFSIFDGPRTVEELAWAEARLAKLGFVIVTEDRIRSYVDQREQFVVYANPRKYGQISFTAYAKPVRKRDHNRPVSSFILFDRWKNDLRRKYEARLPLIKKTRPLSSFSNSSD